MLSEAEGSLLQMQDLCSLRLCKIKYDKQPNQTGLHLARTDRNCQIRLELLKIIDIPFAFSAPLRELMLLSLIRLILTVRLIPVSYNSAPPSFLLFFVFDVDEITFK